MKENILNILQNLYFEALQNGTMSFEQFNKTQQQFYFAVLFFSRPMAILVGKIPNPSDRLDILHDVMEEHGIWLKVPFMNLPSNNFSSPSVVSPYVMMCYPYAPNSEPLIACYSPPALSMS